MSGGCGLERRESHVIRLNTVIKGFVEVKRECGVVK